MQFLSIGVNECADDIIEHITNAPDKILIHCMPQFKNKELLETIKNVFAGKVIFCTGCEICMPGIKINESKGKTDDL